MRGRILSTLGLWGLVAVLVAVMGVHGPILLLAVTAALAQHEFHALLRRAGGEVVPVVGLAAGLAIIGGHHLLPLAGGTVTGVALALAVLAIGLRPPLDVAVRRLSGTLLGIVLIPWMAHFLVRIVHHFETPEQGLAMAVLVVAMAKFTDVGGLLAGMAFGKRKLAPSISPAKTWEGVVGGLALSATVAAIAVAVLHAAFPSLVPMDLTPLDAALVAIPVGAVSVASDLLESVFKRVAGAKDSGRTIPGIGGAFDLLDSVLLSAPIGFLLLPLLAR